MGLSITELLLPGWFGRRYVWYFRLEKLQHFIFSPDSSRKFIASYLWIWNWIKFLTRFCISTEKWDGKRVFKAAGSAWGPTSTFTKNAGKWIHTDNHIKQTFTTPSYSWLAFLIANFRKSSDFRYISNLTRFPRVARPLNEISSSRNEIRHS